MKKSIIWALLLCCVLLLGAIAPAMAADVFAFAEKSVTLFEGETWDAALTREGLPAEAGTLTFSSANPKAATVSEDGTVTAVAKGKATITAVLKGEKRSWKATANVTVLRPVRKVTLSTKNLTVYDHDDSALDGLLAQNEGEGSLWTKVLVLSAGRTAQLSAVCSPEDASSRKVTFTTSDAGVARITGGTTLKAEQRGECDLTVASVQNPEVTETVHVLVIQPVKKVTVQAESKSVAAGDSIRLTATCAPDNASIQAVTWKSANPSVASVDEDGLVTGLKKGTVTITATAADGSGIKGSVSLTITQNAEEITLDKTSIQVVAGGAASYLRATVLPATASNRNVTWESSDSSVARVEKGKVTGVAPGDCVIIARSASNPEVTAEAEVRVIRRVSKITFARSGGVELPVETSTQLQWTIEPYDATIQELTFTSSYPAIASVDANGVVSGLKRGGTTITAKATDGSGKQAQIRVTVTQPVEGVELKSVLHHVQIETSDHRATALTIPQDANNQNMSWSTGDPDIASVRGSKNAVYITGKRLGTTSLTVVTEDGGYTATGEVRVADYNGAVRVDDIHVETKTNKIRITLQNISNFEIDRVNFRINCFDKDGNPLVCNTDGVSTSFEGSYPQMLEAGAESVHGVFIFRNAVFNEPLGRVTLTILSWTDAEGYTWSIPEEEQIPRSWDWWLYQDTGVSYSNGGNE